MSRVACSHQIDFPLVNAVRKRARKQYEIPLHVPGHKKGEGVEPRFKQLMGSNAFQCDLTELNGLDNLACPNDVIKEAQSLAAAAFGADKTWFLVNGCSVGIHAAIMATCDKDSFLVLARNCHSSALSGLILSGSTPHYVFPSVDIVNGVAHCISAESIRCELEELTASHFKVGGVLIVSPTYFGAVADVKGIADVCHSFDVPLIVDEAHGSHFKFHTSFPSSGLECGADIAVQSSHKCLSSLTQSAMLHVKSPRVCSMKIEKCLRILQTSSPSYLLMASLDACRGQCQDPSLFQGPLEAAKEAERILQTVPRVKILHLDETALSLVENFDPLKVCIGIEDSGTSGDDLSIALEDSYGVVPEFSTEKYVICAFGPGSHFRDGRVLAEAIQDYVRNGLSVGGNFSSQLSWKSSEAEFIRPVVEMIPREAFYASTRRVRLSASVGLICAESVCPYPPGIPIISPGEKLTGQIVEALQDMRLGSRKIVGPQDPTFQTIEVVDCSV